MKMFAWCSPRGLLLAVLCVAGIVPAYAADQWYAVELIVFAQRHPDAGNEVWPDNPGMPDITSAQDIPIVADKDAPLQPLPPDQFKLQAEAQKLTDDSNDYEVLLHTGWLQPGLLREKGIPIHIHTAVPAATDTTSAPTSAGAAAPTEPGSAQAPRLDGVVTLTLSRYLHLDVDLVLRGQPEEVSAPTTPGNDSFFGTAPTQMRIPLYRLNESRRMRSKELHYFDHPMFGVLAIVTPYDLPAATPAPAAAPAAPAAAPQTSTGNGGLIRRN